MGLLAVLSLYCVGALAIEGLRFEFPVLVSFFCRDSRTAVKPHSSTSRKRVQRHWGLISAGDRQAPQTQQDLPLLQPLTQPQLQLTR